MAGELADLPYDMQRFYRCFEPWRSAHTGRLWASAVELAREHGVFPTAKALRLDYGKLTERAETVGPAAKRRGGKVRRPAWRTSLPESIRTLASTILTIL